MPANVPFGVADASLSGAVYTPQSRDSPVTVDLPTATRSLQQAQHGGLPEGNYYIVSEAACARAAPPPSARPARA